MSKQLSMAYAVCRGVARSKAKNFYWAFLALPREKRNALCAVYAFMRHADDIADEPGLTLEQRRSELNAWAESIVRACNGSPSDDPVIMALADSQRRFSIPVQLFEQLVYGTALDLNFTPAPGAEAPSAPYRTFDELYQYCYYVASVVGLVCIRVFGYKDAAAEPLAERLGVAFQLTNIIRDVREDASLGRVYLPQEDLLRFGRSAQELSPSSLRNGFQPSQFKPLLAFEAQRARELYAAAELLIPMVEDDSQPCLWALVQIYRRLLDRIAERDFDVFRERVSLKVTEKASILAQGMLKMIF